MPGQIDDDIVLIRSAAEEYNESARVLDTPLLRRMGRVRAQKGAALLIVCERYEAVRDDLRECEGHSAEYLQMHVAASAADWSPETPLSAYFEEVLARRRDDAAVIADYQRQLASALARCSVAEYELQKELTLSGRGINGAGFVSALNTERCAICKKDSPSSEMVDGVGTPLGDEDAVEVRLCERCAALVKEVCNDEL